MSTVSAWAALAAGGQLQAYEYEVGALPADQVEVEIEHCGICHSDLSMLDNEWGIARYPLVPGHEAMGRIVALGENAPGLKIGQRVGIGWNSSSCMHCHTCLNGDQHLCVTAGRTIIGRHGAFANRVRVHWVWAIPVPDALESSAVGPLLCGGITVFYPLLHFGIKPTQRVGVVGIGGLGHIALKFLRAWGCEVTAFSSSESKHAEALQFGAHRVVSNRDKAAMRAIKGSLDLILNTVSAPLDWNALLATLAPKGRLHFVGSAIEPMPLVPMKLIQKQLEVSGSPTGPRSAMDRMLEFAARHQISPQIERFKMSSVNDAMEHLRAGKARYRIVLEADFPKK